jgi:hypothetical protein
MGGIKRLSATTKTADAVLGKRIVVGGMKI